MKRSNSNKEDQNAADGGVLLKRSNSKEEQKEKVAASPEVLEDSYLVFQLIHSLQNLVCINVEKKRRVPPSVNNLSSTSGPRPDEKVVEQTNPESETSESAYQNAAHQK